MRYYRAKDLSLAIRDLPGHNLREVSASSNKVILSGSVMTITGMQREDIGALCTIAISDMWDYGALKPLVKCHEAWIARSVDWHANNNGLLCWEIPIKWNHQITGLDKISTALVPEFAALYLLNSTSWLIGRHRLRHLFNLSKWKEEWPQWEHYDDGYLEYERETLNKR